ncbi:MAG: LysM peptidoglycan-binding domain-containing protein [Thermodesulfobacteriota bacterium]
MPDHKVKEGDCLSSIAVQYGISWEKIWNHPKNSSLKAKRQDPNVLYPGDVVFIPDKEDKEESGGTEQKHRFKAKGAMAKIKIRLTIDDEPRANEPYKLEIEGQTKEGTTDGDGYLEEKIPAKAKGGKLIVGEGHAQDIYEFQLGTIDPIDTDEGIKCRLFNLGYAIKQDLSITIREFQQKEGLNVTGVADEATRNRLKEKFGQ